MSDNALAIIKIGGRLDPARAEVLIEAIDETHVFAQRGDTYFEPRSVENLLAALNDEGLLQLTDDSAPWGEMPAITRACHELRLSYRLWSEAAGDHGSEVTIWTPDMERPLLLLGDHMDPDAILIDSKLVTEALEALKDGRPEEAETLLEGAVPNVRGLPRVEVDTERPAVVEPGHRVDATG